MGIEPTLSAWKAEVLPLNYTRSNMVEGEGFEPSKAEPSDLQSDPFDRSGTPPESIANDKDLSLPGQHILSILGKIISTG